MRNDKEAIDAREEFWKETKNNAKAKTKRLFITFIGAMICLAVAKLIKILFF